MPEWRRFSQAPARRSPIARQAPPSFPQRRTGTARRIARSPIGRHWPRNTRAPIFRRPFAGMARSRSIRMLIAKRSTVAFPTGRWKCAGWSIRHSRSAWRISAACRSAPRSPATIVSRAGARSANGPARSYPPCSMQRACRRARTSSSFAVRTISTGRTITRASTWSMPITRRRSSRTCRRSAGRRARSGPARSDAPAW